MIRLFEHNRIAYESAIAMLLETGKAAIVHPTGTGKSFIGFKMCEDNPDKVICWLSPSEYIFKTQNENLKAASDGYEPDNVIFYTYAKLMLMSKEEIAEINPDYIILDEFHRCGAEMWGQGVETLLTTFPDVPILGLSATAIRYLDNQRDMADELFDGNIASEMTLGEAIVRGILNPPKYIQSVFSYQKDLDKYTKRVKRAKNKAVRNAGEEYLEAIRRAIEKADGLDVIFDKHMTDRAGKYIIFCANKEHMDEMRSHTKEWFQKVDKKPHVYTLYTEDPSASKSFQAFKEDDDNQHLRLLYAIDALNEGVHVEDVSGVILLRPTVSPIIYKQQIGRALSASKKKEPIIFDIVNNVENLYSIGAIEEEMHAAITYYNYFDNDFEIVNERFAVYDEVKDCRILFEELENTLTASWDYMYREAEKYYAEHKDLEAPSRYKTEEGYSLGSWLQTQRKVRMGEQFGNLNEERIAKLDAIGMRWESCRDMAWNRFYQASKAYYDKHGNLDVKTSYVTDDGIRLGTWIAYLRKMRRASNVSEYITKERIAMLDNIGMIWDQPDYVFERNYAAALEYYRIHGNLDVPAKCIVNGVKLGVWIRNLRSTINGKKQFAEITDEQVARLNAIGMCWTDKFTALWEEGYAEAEKYYSEHADLAVPIAYISQSGYSLGKWISRQREYYRDGKLGSERIERLEKLKMSWNKTRQNDWNDCFEALKAFCKEHGNIDVPPDYKAGRIWLNKWLNEQKHIYLGNRPGKSLTDEQIQKLESVGMKWGGKADRSWYARYEELCEWYEKNGDICIPARTALSTWLIVQRKKYREGKLSEDQIAKLSELGMVWQLDDGWETGFEHAKAYAIAHPGESIPTKYVCEDGYNLGIWWNNQRYKYTNGKYSKTRAERLKKIGLLLTDTRKDSQWYTSFEFYKQYKLSHDGEPGVREKIEGINLHEWIRTQRIKYREGNLDEEKVKLLESVSVDWLFPLERKWESYYLSASRYYAKHGNLDVPFLYRDEQGYALGRWLQKQKTDLDELTVTWANGDRKKRLEQIGIVWSNI